MIPRILHHVWPGHDELREPFRSYRETWARHHPDWTMLFWRLRTPTGEPIEDREVAQVLAHPGRSVVVKSDILRLYALERFGGVYVDTDMECLRPIDSMLSAGCFCGEEGGRFACPSVIGATPRHPFVSLMLRQALLGLRAVSVDEANRRPNEITGPHLMTGLVRSRRDVFVHPRETFYPSGAAQPGTYGIHHWAGLGPDGWTRKLTLGHKDEDAQPTMTRGAAG